MAELRQIDGMKAGTALITHVQRRSVTTEVSLYTSNAMQRAYYVPEPAVTDTPP